MECRRTLTIARRMSSTCTHITGQWRSVPFPSSDVLLTAGFITIPDRPTSLPSCAHTTASTKPLLATTQPCLVNQDPCGNILASKDM